MHCVLFFLSICFTLLLRVSGHACAWHPSMWGFNVTDANNTPKDPLMARNFDQWWFHGHLAHPPHPTDWLEFPAGGKTTVEITCDKGATSYWPTNPGGKLGDVVNGDDVCPGSPTSEYHTTGLSDVKGCAFAIAYIPPSEVQTIKPEDFTIFSVNQTCVWRRHTDFHVPANMPACPPGGCTCAWFWIHSADSGSEQIYMNGYQCNITGATSTVPVAQPQVARRCGNFSEADGVGDKPAAPSNCTYGAKQPLYWLQNPGQGNNEFEDAHHPPYYNDLYHFLDGAQDDIFVDAQLPTMTWAGAPTGTLKAVAGNFGSAGPSNSVPTVVPVSPAPSGSSQSNPDASSAPRTAPSQPVPASQQAPTQTRASSLPKNSGTSEPSHPEGCKCRKCKNKSAGLTPTGSATPGKQSVSVSDAVTTISPEEASAIISGAKAQSTGPISPQPPNTCSSKTRRSRQAIIPEHEIEHDHIYAHRRHLNRFGTH